MDSNEREALARRVAHGFHSVCAKLAELEPEISILWIEFENLLPGEKIWGCRYKYEYCNIRLGKHERTVQAMLAKKKQNTGEKLSRPTSIIDLFFKQVSSFTSEKNLGILTEFCQHLQHEPVTQHESETVAAIREAVTHHMETMNGVLEVIEDICPKPEIKLQPLMVRKLSRFQEPMQAG